LSRRLQLSLYSGVFHIEGGMIMNTDITSKCFTEEYIPNYQIS
jgi:hypothetical protein